ncbi:hypothetical protein ACF0H5_023513 [Mactra antiquata]
MLVTGKDEDFSTILRNLYKLEMDKSSLPEADQVHDDVSNSYAIQITVAFYCLVLIFGLVTNIILSYLLFTRDFMKSKYIFTASISIAHIVFCVLAIPLAIIFYVTNDDTINKICDIIVCLCISATTHSMLGTSVRRSLAISERFRHANFTYRGKVKHIACLWIASLVLAVPYSFNKNDSCLTSIFPVEQMYLLHTSAANGTTTTHGETIINNSASSNTSSMSKQMFTIGQYDISKNSTFTVDNESKILNHDSTGFFIYDIILFFIIMILPIVIALILYFITLRGIKNRPNQNHWVKEIMITKQHIAVATIFFVCWFPAMLVNILGQRIEIKETVYRVLHQIGVSSILYFPLVYYKLNAHIRREFDQWRHDLFQSQHQQQ